MCSIYRHTVETNYHKLEKPSKQSQNEARILHKSTIRNRHQYPLKTLCLNIICCKCVRKSWLDLLETREFVKSYLSKSVSGLAVFHKELHSKLYNFFEFVDVLNHEHHDLHYNPIFNFDFPYDAFIEGSANGFLFLCNTSSKSDGLCNPITRDYSKLNCPKELANCYPQVYTYGFGVSKMTGQHKVVKIFHNCTCNQETRKWEKILEAKCQVYTLGTRSWRRLGLDAPLVYCCSNIGAFVNGNLHWFVCDLKGSPWISCFDLETQTFSAFSPLPLQGRPDVYVEDMFALGDYLYLCDNGSDDEIVFWLMKECGVEKSWTKEFVISKIPNFVGESYEVVCPIKVFKDGDNLMLWKAGCWHITPTRLKLFKELISLNIVIISTQSFTPQAFFHSRVLDLRM